MKKKIFFVINKIISAIGLVFGFLLSEKVCIFFKYVFNSFYSGTIKARLKRAGNNFFCDYPVDIKGAKYISIGHNCGIYARSKLEVFDLIPTYTPQLEIGNNVNIISDCHIGCVNYIKIGDGVLIASKVFITDHYHGEIVSSELLIPPSERKIYSKGSVIIEDNVWIGEGVAIMPDVIIGRNSIIGANAVVTKSFPPNSIIGGVPAKLLRTL